MTTTTTKTATRGDWTDDLQSHRTDCAQCYGGECNCGAFEHNERIYAEQPSDPAELSQHTPTPWRVGGHPHDDSGTSWREIVSDATEYAPSFVGSMLEQDAEHAVLCVNSHAILIAALEDELRALRIWQHAIHPRSDVQEGIAINIDKIERALRQARDGE